MKILLLKTQIEHRIRLSYKQILKMRINLISLTYDIFDTAHKSSSNQFQEGNRE